MKLLFISDVHLGALSESETADLEEEIIQIINFCESHDYTIHILGDLFDYWMEFPNYTPPIGQNVLNRFTEYHKSNTSGLFITGNHDYWTKEHFRNCGFEVEHEFRILQQENISFFLTHGDGLSDSQYDLERPTLHKILRNRKFIKLFQSIFKGDTGNHVMKSFSELTRDNRNLNTERLSKWAKNTLDNHTFNYIITGHDHVPRKETFSTGSYINTGAYYLHKTAAVYNNGEVNLVTWDNDNMIFKPFSINSDKSVFL